jgi:hypothetical protein
MGHTPAAAILVRDHRPGTGAPGAAQGIDLALSEPSQVEAMQRPLPSTRRPFHDASHVLESAWVQPGQRGPAGHKIMFPA